MLVALHHALDRRFGLTLEERRHPRQGRQGPPVTENDWLTGAPVFEEDLSSVSGRELGHGSPSLFRLDFGSACQSLTLAAGVAI